MRKVLVVVVLAGAISLGYLAGVTGTMDLRDQVPAAQIVLAARAAVIQQNKEAEEDLLRSGRGSVSTAEFVDKFEKMQRASANK